MLHGDFEIVLACVREFRGPSCKFPTGGDWCADLFVGVVCGSVSELFGGVFLCVRPPAMVVLSVEWKVSFFCEFVPSKGGGRGMCCQVRNMVLDDGGYMVSVPVCRPCRSDDVWCVLVSFVMFSLHMVPLDEALCKVFPQRGSERGGVGIYLERARSDA